MKVNFSVDSQLLRELGARLVGQPHIALAELIKNSYDADATQVVVKMRQDRIEIIDNGQGMTFEELRLRWMRIGTTQKATEQVSRRLERPLTGSKGVGRLAVQLLGNDLLLESTSDRQPGQMIKVRINWDEAVQAGLLTEATANVTERSGTPELPDNSPSGTRIVITALQQPWTSLTLRDVAREIWPLQPPFGVDPGRSAEAFTVKLDTGNRFQEEAFNTQMHAVLQIWTSRIIGELLPDDNVLPRGAVKVQRPRLEADTVLDTSDEAADLLTAAPPDAPGSPRTVRLSLNFDDGGREVVHYVLEDCALDQLKFEIRVYNLKYRQPSGISVHQARAYLRRFGGVHIYDAGFHLPYYGPDTDWLHIEMDHSHRLSVSKLLPKELTQGSSAVSPLNYLPTNSRLFGVVDVDTSHELRVAGEISPAAAREALSIQLTRDRLADTQGYRSLVQLTRFAVDFYAIREAQRAWERKAAALSRKKPSDYFPDEDSGGYDDEPSAADQASLVEDLLDETSDFLPEETVDQLRTHIRDVADRARREQEISEARVGLLGALATAGIAAVAYEHEAAKQNLVLASLASKLRNRTTSPEAAADQLDQWIERARATRRMFSHLLDEQTRDSRGKFLARAVVDDAVAQVHPFARGVDISADGVPQDMRLPVGGYAEWIALLQNVLLNAVNATLDSSVRRIDIDASNDITGSWLRIQDTGSGVDLATAPALFLPFERRQAISAERVSLGLGGSGLGLTIVQMLASDLHANVAFEQPDPGYSTAFVTRWRE
jgi:signal transduction histidine kinase